MSSEQSAAASFSADPKVNQEIDHTGNKTEHDEGQESEHRRDYQRENEKDHDTEHKGDRQRENKTEHDNDHETDHPKDHETEHKKYHKSDQGKDHEIDHEKDHETDHPKDHEAEHEKDHQTDHETVDHPNDHETEHKNDHEADHPNDHETEHKNDHEADRQKDYDKSDDSSVESDSDYDGYYDDSDFILDEGQQQDVAQTPPVVTPDCNPLVEAVATSDLTQVSRALDDPLCQITEVELKQALTKAANLNWLAGLAQLLPLLPDQQGQGDFLRDLLSSCVSAGNYQLCELVLAQGCGELGETGLILTVQRHPTSVELARRCLATSGVNERDLHGRTALSYAAQAGNASLVALLIKEAGADARIADLQGMTPLEYALAALIDSLEDDLKREELNEIIEYLDK